MRMIRAHKGQTMAEYAVLFAIVIGAAVAVQYYIRLRIQGAVTNYADNYQQATKAGTTGTRLIFVGDVNRLSTSSSATDLDFASSRKGVVRSASGGETTIEANKGNEKFK